MSHNVPQCLTLKIDSAPDPLQDRQRLALELILLGKPDTHVARVVGVNRRTLGRWRHEDPVFAGELHRRRKERWEGTADRIRELLSPAVEVLADQLADHLDRTRYRAATALLKLANVKSAVPILPLL